MYPVMTKTAITTTIDQHQGDHPTGMRMMRLVTVTTSSSELDDDAVADLHRAEVELASLDAGPRARARDAIADAQSDEEAAAAIRRAIADAQSDEEAAAAMLRDIDAMR